MNLPGSQLLSRLFGKKPGQVAPVTPETQIPLHSPDRVITRFQPGAAEALEGAQTATALGKPIAAEILRKTAEDGITTTIVSAEKKG